MPVEIELKTGGITIVSDEDASLASYDWFQNSRGYVISAEPFRGMARLHREIMARMVEHDLTPWMQIDHIDGDPLNNQRDNLRLATHSQNQANRGPNGRRRYKGVYRSPTQGRWYAKIMADGKQHYLGTFSTAVAAARAYDAAARELHGEFAYQNLGSVS